MADGATAGRCLASAWRDLPVRPHVPWQESGKGGKDRAVGSVQPQPEMGWAQHGDLVPQHEQLTAPSMGSL